MTATRSARASALQVLVHALLWAGLASAAAAQGPTMWVEADDASVELLGSNAQCVQDSSGLHCTALPADGAPPSSQAASTVTSLAGVISFHNLTATAQTFIIVVTLPVPPQPMPMIGGSV